jgi:uncharacterized protein YggE
MKFIMIGLCCSIGLLSASSSLAQIGVADPARQGSGTVVGSGTASIERPVEIMRLSIVLTARAKELKPALVNLTDRIAAARLQLESFGAIEDSIETTPASLAKKSPQQVQMEQMLAQQRLAQGRSVPKGLQVTPAVAVQSTLTAQWQLAATDREELLQFVSSLQDKIKQADLGGLNEPNQLSAAEQELAEELEGMSSMYGEETANPGEPQFVFVGRIDETQKQAALAQAFAKAKDQATQLASAAGVTLGPLASLHGDITQGDNSQLGYEYRYYLQASGQTAAAASENEAISSEPDTVTFQANVHAAFRLP